MKNINFVKIFLTSPKKILSWSNGEVKNSETLNYRTLKPEHEGLFCTRIFGPVYSYVCDCNFYNSKSVNPSCRICKVPYLSSLSRRKRMGHIKLECLVSHVLFFKSVPSKLCNLLNISMINVEKILYYEKFIVTNTASSVYKVGDVLNEKEYYNNLLEFGGRVEIKTGAEAIKVLLDQLDISYEIKKSILLLKGGNLNINDAEKIISRLNYLRSFVRNRMKLNWMLLKYVPVLPPDLRPLVRLDNGKFASSDLNELYRRVINRNNRLRKLNKIGAPDFIVRNEKRLLQESVDDLFIGGKKEGFFKSDNKTPLKALADNIKGKKGLFRYNLLGKRVDYSARAVIIVNPIGGLNECGLPVGIAIELFRPFLYNKLISNSICCSLVHAKGEVDKKSSIVIYFLKKLLEKSYVLLNRAPTLHRMNIQGFKPVLVKDNAIHIHPLVCSAFNADFDGDQMAVHIPLSRESRIEVKTILKCSKNIFSPSNGSVTILPSQEIILGLYYLTLSDVQLGKHLRVFSSVSSVINYFYLYGRLHEQILFNVSKGKFIKTSIGRIFLYNILPNKILFNKFNILLKKSTIVTLINEVFTISGSVDVLKKFILNITKIGFRFATISGLSLSIGDFLIPSKKKTVLSKSFKNYNYYNWMVSNKKMSLILRYKHVIDLWNKTSEKISLYVTDSLSKKYFLINRKRYFFPSNSVLYGMMTSGAKGTGSQIRQLSGIRGLVLDSNGKVIDVPIFNNLREGLGGIQYFVSTYGARKGLSDTSLKTASSGYLTRRLVDVVQNISIKREDCYTTKGLRIRLNSNVCFNYFGRLLLFNVYNNYGKTLVKRNSALSPSVLLLLRKFCAGFIYVRSPAYCFLYDGVCVCCYGFDLSRKKLVNLGEAVGVIAAQSIGEPGTQLTMRTFHSGGVYSGNILKYSKGEQFYCFLKLSSMLLSNLSLLTEKPYFSLGKVFFLGLNSIVLSSEVHKGIGLVGSCFNNSFIFRSQIVSIKSERLNNCFYVKEFCFLRVKGLNKNSDLIYSFFRDSMSVYVRSLDMIEKPRIEVHYKESSCVIHIKKGSILSIPISSYLQGGEVLVQYPINMSINDDITSSLDIISGFFEARKKPDTYLMKVSGSIVCTVGRFYLFHKFISKDRGYCIQRRLLPLKHFSSDASRQSIFLKGFRILSAQRGFFNILSVGGVNSFLKEFVSRTLNIYHKYGVIIDRKHLEVILKQMVSKVIITSSDGYYYYYGDRAERNSVNILNVFFNSIPVVYEGILYGITKLALANSSFISAASFQETNRILTDAAFLCKKDYLLGVKENVILGRLIPVGTGFSYYKIFNKKCQQ